MQAALPAPRSWHAATPPAAVGLAPDPAARRWAGAAVVALHAVALLGLLQAGVFKAPKRVQADVTVQLLTERSKAPEAPPRQAAPQLNVPAVAHPVPLPEFSIAQPARELPLGAPLVQAVTLPAAPARTAPPADEVAPRMTPQPPAPKPVAAGSLRYRIEPAVEVPRLSRRAGEQGSVQLRVVFDVEGRPRQVELARGSGFARLDTQALEAMQAARIQPYLEAGRPIEVVALATLEYQLD